MLSLLGFSCAENALEAQNKLAPDAFEAEIKLNTTVQLIDVRTPEEFQEGHLAGAQNMNVQSSDFAQKINQLDKKQPVLVYCAVGGRSAKAAKQVSEMGFPKVYDLKGGITAWKSAGKALEK